VFSKYADYTKQRLYVYQNDDKGTNKEKIILTPTKKASDYLGSFDFTGADGRI
jgi:hypothetical protein